MRYTLLFISILIGAVALGCAGITPHENFKSHIYGQIGKSLNEIPPYQAPLKEELVDSKILPNGNIENKYKHYRGNCFYFYEIEPKANKIVSARFEGKESDCIINP